MLIINSNWNIVSKNSLLNKVKYRYVTKINARIIRWNHQRRAWQNWTQKTKFYYWLNYFWEVFQKYHSFTFKYFYLSVFSDQSVHYLRLTARHFHILSNARFITSLFTRIEDAPDRKLLTFSVFFFVWGVIEFLESIGLAKRKRWAEYLIVVFTGLFIPVETYTVLARFTIEKFLLFLFNIFLVYYLIQSRKLFKVAK